MYRMCVKECVCEREREKKERAKGVNQRSPSEGWRVNKQRSSDLIGSKPIFVRINALNTYSTRISSNSESVAISLQILHALYCARQMYCTRRTQQQYIITLSNHYSVRALYILQMYKYYMYTEYNLLQCSHMYSNWI